MRDGFSTLAGNFDPLQYQVPGTSLVVMLEARGFSVADADRERITGCGDVTPGVRSASSLGGPHPHDPSTLPPRSFPTSSLPNPARSRP